MCPEESESWVLIAAAQLVSADHSSLISVRRKSRPALPEAHKTTIRSSCDMSIERPLRALLIEGTGTPVPETLRNDHLLIPSDLRAAPRFWLIACRSILFLNVSLAAAYISSNFPSSWFLLKASTCPFRPRNRVSQEIASANANGEKRITNRFHRSNSLPTQWPVIGHRQVIWTRFLGGPLDRVKE